MRIGIVCEDEEHEAFLRGLGSHWCTYATIERGPHRGSTGQSLRRELPKALQALRLRKVDFFVVLRDANTDDWQKVRAEELRLVPVDFHPFLVYGVPDRNIECWVTMDRNYFVQFTSCEPQHLNVPDPEMVVKRILRDVGWENARKGIFALVSNASAPIRNWIEASPSFERFYEDCRALALRNSCGFPNERERMP